MALLHRLADLDRARQLLERAVELDPRLAAAYAWRAFWHTLNVAEGQSADLDRDISEAARLAEIALTLDPEDALALSLSAHALAFLRHDLDQALGRFERARRLNPNCAFAWNTSALTFCYLGQPAIALERARYAIRLSPFDPWMSGFHGALAFAEVLGGQWEEAVRSAGYARGRGPRLGANLRQLAACLAHLGRVDEAREVGRELLAVQPGFTVSGFRTRYSLRDESALELSAANLLKAGLPAWSSPEGSEPPNPRLGKQRSSGGDIRLSSCLPLVVSFPNGPLEQGTGLRQAEGFRSARSGGR